MEVLLGWLASVPVWAVYLIAFVCPALESSTLIGMLVPGETAMIAAGAVAASGEASVWLTWGLGAAGAIVGDSLGYLLGRKKGDAILHGRLGRKIGRERWEKARKHLTQHGFFTVMFSRFALALRTLVAIAAGAARQPYGRFFAANALGGILWAAASVGLGWGLGQSLRRLEKAHWIVTAVGLLLLAAGALGVSHLVSRRKRRR